MISVTIDTGALGASDWFSSGHHILQAYEVTKVIKTGKVFQLLHIDDSYGKTKIVKVLCHNIQEYTSNIKKEILWFRNRRLSDARRSVFETTYKDRHFTYLVFKAPDFTLRDVLNKEAGLTELPRRHIREISLQILRALESLHAEGISHTDICPENVHVLSMETVQELVYYAEEFVVMRILKSAQIQLGFYGCAGIRGTEMLGTDLYRSPEAVFKCEYGPEGDLFSFALISVEMDMGKPLFLPCAEGEDYAKLKAIQFDELFGPFGKAHMAYINDACGSIFDLPHGIIDDWNIPLALKAYLARDHTLKYCMSDMSLTDLLSYVLVLDPQKRASIDRLLVSDYF